MLNEIINIDLHIHSCFSEYKDGDIVKESTIENLDKLMTKLSENKISLCSITDHNRFSYELYDLLKKKINASNSILKHNLPGIEFDVELEIGKPKCHIIAIFDDSDDDKVKKIEEKMFEIKKLSKSDEYYSLDEFERVLKNIGINVILIVHQRQGLNNNSGNTNSLSNATSNPSEFIKVGFIDCLEYNYPRIEGIVKNSLRNVGLSFPIITGSDCHEWKYYPYHDKNTNKTPRDFTKFKCLPSFKGLLMSITSFETRVNRNNNENRHYIKNISINGVKYPLSNGINAIIGDNGSGKSLLASVLANNIEKYYKKLIEKNNISIDYNDSSFQKNEINYIKQGEIVEQVRNGNLFDDNNKVYFEDISTKDVFSLQIKKYFDNICTYVNKNIVINELFNNLSKTNLVITPIDKKFYHPLIKTDIELDDINVDKNRIDELNKIINSLKLEIDDNIDYYKNKNVNIMLQDALNKLVESKNLITKIYNLKKQNNRVKSIIKNKLLDLKTDLDRKRTSDESNRTKIIGLYDKFKKTIIECIKSKQIKNEYPIFPKKLTGFSIKEYKGYNFCKTAKYNQLDLKDEFYDYCFNKDYKNDEAIKKIKTKDEFSNALSNYGYTQLEEFKKIKLDGFINEYSKETTTISEIASSSDIGNTPGEISLVYYKFTIQEVDEEYNVLIIDQPEDDINPNRIKTYLNSYLNSIKDEKQIILITHNPLLVVNLDVDNVVHLTKINNMIEVKNGALEYENNEYSILDLVKENLDGGYEAIERRLKAYGKDNY